MLCVGLCVRHSASGLYFVYQSAVWVCACIIARVASRVSSRSVCALQRTLNIT